MKPMALNVPIAMIMSLAIAFTVTPWATYHALRSEYHAESKPYDLMSGPVYRYYSRLISPFLDSRRKSRLFLGGTALAFCLSLVFLAVGIVPVKMLPFDNRNEFLVQIDMPEGTTLETTDKVVEDVERYLSRVNEVRDIESFVGLPSPIDFNGMVRQYYLREGSALADIRVNLLDKHDREYQSHPLVLRLRPDIEEIAKRWSAVIKLVEVPPGPPVLSTIVAEVYGPFSASYESLIQQAKEVRKIMENTPNVVDIDDSVTAPQRQLNFVIDRTKAGIHGIAEEEIAQSARIFLGGESPSIVHSDTERSPLEINVRLPRSLRSRMEDMAPLRIKGADGLMVPFHELGSIQETTVDYSIFRKNLDRVVLVTAETAGGSPVNSIMDLKAALETNGMKPGYRVDWAGEGEWKITLEVFRDLGLAFAGALILIYVLLVHQTQSFLLPLVIMVAIPLTLIGILPGFALLNSLLAHQIGPYRDCIYFTATSMIGMIALAGIVVRNSIILIDFVQVRVQAGENLRQAIIESGAVRLTPILLTAGAAIFGSWVITLDPVFSGLAWSFIFGIFASSLFTLIVVPIIYYMIYNKR